MAAFVPSAHQQRYFDWLETGTGSCVVIATAGSGKSTTIIKGLTRISERASVQILVFNTILGAELRDKIAALAEETGRLFDKVSAKTFHSLCFGAVAKKLGKDSRAIRTDGNKSRDICRNWLDQRLMFMYSSFICKLVGLAKGEGIGALVPNTDDRWYKLIQHHDLELEHEEASEAEAVKLAKELLERSNAASLNAHIDFDDQLYLVCLWKLRLWQNDFVFIDEAQDTNPIRRAVAKLALRPGGRLVAVGDPRQAIYGFTGASHDAIELIKKEFNAVEMPLTVSYRCPRAVIEQAQTIVPYIEAAPSAIEGKVSYINIIEALNILGPHDAILCRNTAPLIELAYDLIRRGRGCAVLGKDIGANLVKLIENMKAKGIEALEEKLDAYREREVAKYTAKGEEQKAESVTDRVHCIQIVIKNLNENERTVPKLISKLTSIFSDTNGVLMLSTAHKAKGREWDNVAILRPDLMPSKWARQDWQALQEENLMYVAWTRARKHLMFLV